MANKIFSAQIWQLTILRHLVNKLSRIPHLLDVLLPKTLIICIQAHLLRRQVLCLAVVCELHDHVVVDELVQLQLKVSVALLCNPKSLLRLLLMS